MDLTDEQWNVIRPFIPDPELMRIGKKGGRPWRGPRDVLNGIFWILRTGAPWAELPRRYPPPQTCHRRLQKWVKTRVLVAVLRGLAGDLEYAEDRSHRGVRRRLPRGGKRGALRLERTRRGKATKIMAVADRSGLPVAVGIASGQQNEQSSSSKH